MITIKTMQRVLDKRFGGVLKAGSHTENGECCALELLSVCRKIPWTDRPEKVGSWDLRSLNDIQVADAVRAKHLLPVLALYADSRAWTPTRKKSVVTKLVILSVQRIVAELPGLPSEVSQQCRAANDLKFAAAAAAAAAAARWSAADAIEKVFITACALWLEAAT